MKISTTWPIATAAAITVFLATVPTAVAQFTSSAALTSNSADAGTLQTVFVDGNGLVLNSPAITISNAYPAMTAQTSTIRIKNLGSLPATARLHVANIVDVTAASLNDVLVATIKDSSNTTVYSGSIADIDVPLESLASDSISTFSLSITWPDMVAVDDNPYQDASMQFEIVIDASSIS